jgi:nucleotide-binding universal stress UspA family protein
MKGTSATAPVVVGADGSQAALNAAIWAIDEALSRDVPLRVVHVTGVEQQPADDVRLEIDYAETSLRAVTAAVKATEQPVKIETDILWGAVSTVLIDESRNAAMLCVGSVGIGAVARELLGSTAASLAENAHCPVAIIRSPHDQLRSGANWIAVAVNEAPDNDSVIECAMEEAELRRAPVLAVGVRREHHGETTHDELDRRVDRWKHRCPVVHIYPVATRAGIGGFLAEQTDESVQLAVLGQADIDQLAYIVGPVGRPIVPHGECSVLIVR